MKFTNIKNNELQVLYSNYMRRSYNIVVLLAYYTLTTVTVLPEGSSSLTVP